MMRFIVGVVVTSVVLYVWGFIVWGVGPYGTMIWHQAADDVAAAQAIKEHFPQQGIYFVPGVDHNAGEYEQLYQQGPVAMINVLAPEGRPMMDASIMVRGFLLNVVVVVLVGILLLRTAPVIPKYPNRVGMVALVGLIATILIDLGDWAWWGTALPWKLYQASYNLSAMTLIGAIMACFVRPRPIPEV